MRQHQWHPPTPPSATHASLHVVSLEIASKKEIHTNAQRTHIADDLFILWCWHVAAVISHFTFGSSHNLNQKRRAVNHVLMYNNDMLFRYFHFWILDKQKIENETKVQTQRDSTIEVLEEQLNLCAAKVHSQCDRANKIATTLQFFSRSFLLWAGEKRRSHSFGMRKTIVWNVEWHRKFIQVRLADDGGCDESRDCGYIYQETRINFIRDRKKFIAKWQMVVLERRVDTYWRTDSHRTVGGNPKRFTFDACGEQKQCLAFTHLLRCV